MDRVKLNAERESKHTLIIIYDNLLVGGIEKYIINMVQLCKKMNYRVIWMSPINRMVAIDFHDIIFDGYVEIVKVNKKKQHWFYFDNIHFKSNEIITILSFSVFDFFRAEKLKRIYMDNNEVNTFYMIPHFTGKPYYIERYFRGFNNKIVFDFMSRILKKLVKNNNILFFSKKHVEYFSKNYKITVNNIESRILKPYQLVPSFDFANAYRKSKREYFNIITVGRFEFPHKGYMIGLIRSYGRLKKEIPNLKLTIIGYGEGEEILKSEIQKLDEIYQKDILLVGQISPFKLSQYMKDAHLNISSSGAVSDGAINGVISIPARHYDYECQVYGFLPESKKEILSSEPGLPVEDFIRRVFFMSNMDFVKYSKKSYDSYNTLEEFIPLYIFEQKNRNTSQVLSVTKIEFSKVIYFLLKFKLKLYSYMHSGKNIDNGY